jgi:hypothetical protein
MKKLSTCLFGGALIATGLTSPAIADSVLYDTGIATGNGGDGWGTDNYGTGIADFTLGSAVTVNSFSMTLIGNSTSAAVDVSWAIYSRSGDSVVSLLGSGFFAGLTTSNPVNTGTYPVYDVSVNVGGLNLAAGDYYLATQRDNANSDAFWAYVAAPDGSRGSLANNSTYNTLSGDLFANDTLLNQSVDYAFKINGSTITVVPLPPAAFAGLGILGCMGAYRRIRK